MQQCFGESASCLNPRHGHGQGNPPERTPVPFLVLWALTLTFFWLSLVGRGWLWPQLLGRYFLCPYWGGKASEPSEELEEVT